MRYITNPKALAWHIFYLINFRLCQGRLGLTWHEMGSKRHINRISRGQGKLTLNHINIWNLTTDHGIGHTKIPPYEQDLVGEGILPLAWILPSWPHLRPCPHSQWTDEPTKFTPHLPHSFLFWRQSCSCSPEWPRPDKFPWSRHNLSDRGLTSSHWRNRCIPYPWSMIPGACQPFPLSSSRTPLVALFVAGWVHVTHAPSSRLSPPVELTTLITTLLAAKAIVVPTMNIPETYVVVVVPSREATSPLLSILQTKNQIPSVSLAAPASSTQGVPDFSFPLTPYAPYCTSWQ